MDVIALHPTQLARLVEYGEVSVYVEAERRVVRFMVRNDEAAPTPAAEGESGGR